MLTSLPSKLQKASAIVPVETLSKISYLLRCLKATLLNLKQLRENEKETKDSARTQKDAESNQLMIQHARLRGRVLHSFKLIRNH